MPDPASDFGASRLYTLLESPFSLWCDYHAPRQELKDETNRYDKLRFRQSRSAADQWLMSLYPSVVSAYRPAPEDSFRVTLEAMAAGAPVISQAFLWNHKKAMFGRTVLVKKEGGNSVFGQYHYEITQLKQALEIKEHYALQAMFLNEILSDMQGFAPSSATIHLKSGDRVIERTEWAHRLDAELERWRDIKAGTLEPELGRPPLAALSPWRQYGNKLAFERKELTLLAGYKWDVRDKLRRAGIKTTDDAATAGLAKLKEAVGGDAVGVYGNALAYLHNKPVLKNRQAFPPRRGARNLYFDFETSDSLSSRYPPHVYLIGIWDKEAAKYVAFTAKGAEEEEKIFKDFAAYVGDANQAALYHWTEYEVNQMRAIAAKYPAIAGTINTLISACVDLKEAVKKAFYIPAPSFSLKAVAPAFGFKWRQSDVGAMDAMVCYWDWLAGDEQAIKKALDYNEDDCYSMLHIDQTLEKLQPVEFPTEKS